jgi:hypothetical protein
VEKVKRIILIILITLLAVIFIVPKSRYYIINGFQSITDDLFLQNNIDYESLIGKWYISDTAKSYIETYSKGGSVLEIVEIRKNYIKGVSASIQVPPANRITSIEFEGKLVNNILTFDFTDDFLNEGTATIHVTQNSIEITISNFKIADENSSGWYYCGGIFLVKDSSS